MTWAPFSPATPEMPRETGIDAWTYQLQLLVFHAGLLSGALR